MMTQIMLQTYFFAHGDFHIDRRKFSVILTCLPEDADILQRECGLCSYSWIGDFDEYIENLY